MSTKKSTSTLATSGLARRSMLKVTAAAAGCLALGAKAVAETVKWLNPRLVQQAAPTTLDKEARVVHSVCLGCNSRCGNRLVVKNGTLEKVSGNPYHPYNSLARPIAYTTPVEKSLSLPSPVCGKAQAAAEYLYSPYRILKPLKRAGARGSGRFEPIEWHELIQEIVNGGKLFSHLGEDRVVRGLNDLNSDEPLDPSAPELGSLRNSFVFISGRLQSGRKEFIDRFVKSSLGSINHISHTDICGLGFRMGNFALTDKKEVELKADPWSAEYILVFGANIYEALQPGINTYGASVAKRTSENNLKFAIVDPRAQNASVHAHEWVPIQPGQDGAFAMGMIRWIVEHDRHNKDFLQAPSQDAAKKKGFACYTNAAHLVIVDPEHPRFRKFLRVGDVDPNASEKDKKSCMVIPRAGAAPESCDKALTGLLDEETTVTGASGQKIRVQTSFRILKEGVMAHSLQDYAKFAGVETGQIERIAKEFTSHGTRAAVCQYHGAGNFLNGTYAAYAIAVLNALIGSVDRKGGYNKSGGGMGKPDKGPYDLASFPGKRKPSGVPISREKIPYEKTAEFKRKKQATGAGYPAKRPWFPFSKGGLCVEAMSGIDEKYPYQCNILFTYFFNPVYSIPGGHRYKETLQDGSKVPLHVSIDVGVNESNVYADYIVPDVTYLEGHYGWLNPHAPSLKFTGVRTPAVEPLTGKTKDNRPFCLETFFIDLAEAASLPGFGQQAIPHQDGKLLPLHCGEDFYLRGIGNLAIANKIPEAGAEDLRFVEQNYPVAAFKNRLDDKEWAQTSYLLARGGMFKQYEDVFDGENFKHGIKKVVLYNEDLASTRNALTGAFFPGSLTYLSPTDVLGKESAQLHPEYPFILVSYKMNIHTQSRTSWHRTALEIVPENAVHINKADADALGLQTGNRVRLMSRSNPAGVVGKVEVTQLVRRGCVAVSFHYGHTQLGASELAVKAAESVFLGKKAVANGDRVRADPALGSGINPNMLSDLDPALANTPMVEPLSGIPDFSSTRVKLVKIG